MSTQCLLEHADSCPYCGERITMLIEDRGEQQCYIEDCEVCCRPITVSIDAEADGGLVVRLLQENDIP